MQSSVEEAIVLCSGMQDMQRQASSCWGGWVNAEDGTNAPCRMGSSLARSHGKSCSEMSGGRVKHKLPNLVWVPVKWIPLPCPQICCETVGLRYPWRIGSKLPAADAKKCECIECSRMHNLHLLLVVSFSNYTLEMHMNRCFWFFLN